MFSKIISATRSALRLDDTPSETYENTASQQLKDELRTAAEGGPMTVTTRRQSHGAQDVDTNLQSTIEKPKKRKSNGRSAKASPKQSPKRRKLVAVEIDNSNFPTDEYAEVTDIPTSSLPRRPRDSNGGVNGVTEDRSAVNGNAETDTPVTATVATAEALDSEAEDTIVLSELPKQARKETSKRSGGDAAEKRRGRAGQETKSQAQKDNKLQKIANHNAQISTSENRDQSTRGLTPPAAHIRFGSEGPDSEELDSMPTKFAGLDERDGFPSFVPGTSSAPTKPNGPDIWDNIPSSVPSSMASPAEDGEDEEDSSEDEAPEALSNTREVEKARQLAEAEAKQTRRQAINSIGSTYVTILTTTL